MWKKRIAISPVISTIILLAIVISVSATVAYWVGGASNQYTKIEKLEIENPIVNSISSEGIVTWIVNVSVKNTGTRSITITDVCVNDISLTNSGSTNPPNPSFGNGSWYVSSPIIRSGASSTFIIVIKNGGVAQPFTSLSHGVSVNLKLHSSDGMDYFNLTELI